MSYMTNKSLTVVRLASITLSNIHTAYPNLYACSCNCLKKKNHKSFHLSPCFKFKFFTGNSCRQVHPSGCQSQWCMAYTAFTLEIRDKTLLGCFLLLFFTAAISENKTNLCNRKYMIDQKCTETRNAHILLLHTV